jgi:vitamin B12 transporter
LRPEKSQGLDVAIDQALFDDRIALSVGYFWTRYRDLILSVFDPVGCGFTPFGFCAQNVGLSRAEGVEASAKIRLVSDQPWVKSFDVQFQYTYTRTDNLSNMNTQLPRWPLNQWSIILSYQPIGGLRANLEGRFVGQRFNDVNNNESMPAFNVWNFSATYDVTKNIQAYMRVDNLFNEQYEEILFFGTPIRSVFGGVRLNYDIPL